MSPKTPKRNSVPRRSRRSIFTVGYEGYTPSQLLDLLARHRIAAVIDVRNRPSSHKPGFSKTPLSRALAKQEIEYIHLPQLGIPREVRVQYREEKDFRVLQRCLKTPLEQHHELLLDILRRFRGHNVCLLCYEKEPSLCHRSIIADFLAEHDGFEIHHLQTE
jgi:uncharacterized protein (DUF488 family)